VLVPPLRRALDTEETATPARPVDVNSAINYLSAAQMHADAVRAARLDPHPRVEEPTRVVAARRTRHISWRLVLGRI
jgi:hypothetical protein